MQVIKILFVDLDSSARNPDGTIRDGVAEALARSRGFVAIGLASLAKGDLFNSDIPAQQSTLQELKKLKVILLPTNQGEDCWKITNSGEVTKVPDACNLGDYRLPNSGMVKFYLNHYLTPPLGWLVSDRPEAETPAVNCGLQYISGVEWRNSA